MAWLRLSRRCFPVRRLILSASAWGGNPDSEAKYLNVFPEKNDGQTVYRLLVGDVPVDGFWSITVYNAEGRLEKNPLDAYSLNDITAVKGEDGTVAVQFGGCDGGIANCLPIVPGWNYMVRPYRPGPEVLDGIWTFPEAQPAKWMLQQGGRRNGRSTDQGAIPFLRISSCAWSVFTGSTPRWRSTPLVLLN